MPARRGGGTGPSIEVADVGSSTVLTCLLSTWCVRPRLMLGTSSSSDLNHFGAALARSASELGKDTAESARPRGE